MKSFLSITFFFMTMTVIAHDSDRLVINRIYENALTTPDAYANLKELCSQAPYRLVGSQPSEKAIQILARQVEKYQPDTFFLQHFTTQSWRCKTPALAWVFYQGKKQPLNVVNLGLSVSSPQSGITAGIVEVHRLSELDSLGGKGLKGKIVFFNRPMDNSELNTFEAYEGAIDQRSLGASKASKYGALAAIVRSLATEDDDYPHTGVSRYKDGVTKIPNMAISTNDAEKLSRLNKEYADVRVRVFSNTETLDSVHTANLIAEIRGSVHPDRVIEIGAHMDAWFNTPGAHDDGAGCEQMIDVLRIFRQLNLHPENTIRLVLYMDEEMYQAGGRVYAKSIANGRERYLAAIESDAGGLLPLGFGVDASDSVINTVRMLTAGLADYGIYRTEKGYGGVDIGFLRPYGIPLIGLMTNSQRYFEYHHSANDTVDKVSRREMQLGTAAIASLVYLIDKHGI